MINRQGVSMTAKEKQRSLFARASAGEMLKCNHSMISELTFPGMAERKMKTKKKEPRQRRWQVGWLFQRLFTRTTRKVAY